MASDIVVRHAQAHPELQATIGVSLFAPSITADTPLDSPRNLLVIVGALEPGLLAREALRVVGRVAGADVQLDTLYGRFEDGTARRATLSPGVEHIGVLYSAHTQAQTLAWLMLGVALSAHEFWLADESVSLLQALGDAFDTMAEGQDLDARLNRERR